MKAGGRAAGIDRREKEAKEGDRRTDGWMDSEEEEEEEIMGARWMREPPHGQGEYIRQIEYRQRRPLPTWPRTHIVGPVWTPDSGGGRRFKIANPHHFFFIIHNSGSFIVNLHGFARSIATIFNLQSAERAQVKGKWLAVPDDCLIS